MTDSQQAGWKQAIDGNNYPQEEQEYNDFLPAAAGWQVEPPGK